MKLITTLIFCLYSTISQAEIYNFTKIYLDTTGSQSVDQVIDSNESVVKLFRKKVHNKRSVWTNRLTRLKSTHS